MQMIELLQQRFAENPQRHAGVLWHDVAARLDADPMKLKVLAEMERTRGEPDVIGVDPKSGLVTFGDCSPESPTGRRSLCFDQKALDARKENKPEGSAIELAVAMGVEIMTEAEYRALQQLGKFDLKTSSWIKTPDAVRALGGALFCDRRYDQVFVYHNGAESYYAARGFRAVVKV